MWKDATSYSRDDKERKPTTFEARSGALRIVVTCGHMDYRPKWVMHCYVLGIDTLPLEKSETKEQAQAEAVEIVFKRLANLTACAEKMVSNYKAQATRTATTEHD